MGQFYCPKCKKQVESSQDMCKNCGEIFTEEEKRELIKKFNRDAFHGFLIILLACVAIWFFFFRSDDKNDLQSTLTQPKEVIEQKNIEAKEIPSGPNTETIAKETPSIPFEPVYIEGEIEDTSVARAKRFTMRITVPDGLDRETLKANLLFAAEKLMDEKDAKVVTIWAHRQSDEQRTAFSAGVCTLAPFGEIGKAVEPNVTREDMRPVFTFDEDYFSDPDSIPTVSKIPEEKRKGIYKEMIFAEKKARMDAMRKAIQKHLKTTPAKNASELELEDLMNKIYMSTKNGMEIIQTLAGDNNAFREKNEAALKKKYKLSDEDYEKIGLEGLKKHWRQE